MKNKLGNMLSKEICDLVKKYCGAEVFAKFVLDQRAIEKVEHRVLKGDAGSKKGIVSPECSVDGRRSFDHLMTICRQNLTASEYLQMLLGVGKTYELHGNMEWAEQTFSMVINHGQKSRCPSQVAEGFLHRGELYSSQGRWNQARQDLDQGRRMFSELNDNLSVARIENILGTNCAEQGLIKEAHRWFTKALPGFEQSRQKLMTGTILMNLGIIQNIIGKWDEALNYYRRALPYFQGVGALNRLAELYHNMGMTHLSIGEYREAVRQFDMSISSSNKIKSPRLQGIAKLGKANAFFYLNDPTLALVFCNQALEHFMKISLENCIADAYKLMGMIHRQLKQFDLAEIYFLSSIRINEDQNNLLNLGETYYELGMLEKARRRIPLSKKAFLAALDLFQKVGAEADTARSTAMLRTLEKAA